MQVLCKYYAIINGSFKFSTLSSLVLYLASKMSLPFLSNIQRMPLKC